MRGLIQYVMLNMSPQIAFLSRALCEPRLKQAWDAGQCLPCLAYIGTWLAGLLLSISCGDGVDL